MLLSLERVGFQVNDGHEGTGFLLNALRRGGGYYLGECLAATPPVVQPR